MVHYQFIVTNVDKTHYVRFVTKTNSFIDLNIHTYTAS
jgi:hypothetical protein